MNNPMKRIFNHWRTTLSGLLISASAAAYPIVSDRGFHPKEDYMLYILALIPIFVGAFLKDDILKKK